MCSLLNSNAITNATTRQKIDAGTAERRRPGRSFPGKEGLYGPTVEGSTIIRSNSWPGPGLRS